MNPNKTAGLGTPDGQYTNNDRPKRRRAPSPKYLIPEEISALLHVITDTRDQAIFRLARHHGLRASEVGMVQMSHYHPGRSAQDDRLEIERLKGSISAEVKLVPAAAHAIRMWIKKRGWAPGPMFRSRQKTPISRQRLDELMKHYCALVEIPREKCHFHSLKHTAGTELLSEFQLPIVHVQEHLGHADIRSTMVYARLTAQASDERAQRLRKWK